MGLTLSEILSLITSQGFSVESLISSMIAKYGPSYVPTLKDIFADLALMPPVPQTSEEMKKNKQG
jgi:hypothetical protein